MELVFSRQASKDFDEIYQYGFSRFGEIQADNYAAKLVSCFKNLCTNPEIGRLDARVKPAIRRFEIGSHIVCYDLFKDQIIIVRILRKSVNFLSHI